MSGGFRGYKIQLIGGLYGESKEMVKGAVLEDRAGGPTARARYSQREYSRLIS